MNAILKYNIKTKTPPGNTTTIRYVKSYFAFLATNMKNNENFCSEKSEKIKTNQKGDYKDT